MEIFIERENTRKQLKFNGKVSILLQKLKLNPAAVLVSKNSSLVTEDDVLSDDDEVKILSVISGG
ncbi:MoaD/ThiS family protein [Candidatus Woesearchaeota archaeon]|nr:MoaD/ThiS family protein [Candidatus Woesearchaeota archaeon]